MSNKEKKDENSDVVDDNENDYKWCEIDLVQLYITIKINENYLV